jgi:hypothetical protein
MCPGKPPCELASRYAEWRLASVATAAFAKVCGCRAQMVSAAHTGGRRAQTSKGGNRGRGGVAGRRRYGVRRWRLPGRVECLLGGAVERVTKLFGRLR